MYIRNFKNIIKNNTNIVGGKGASLGEMTQAGIPVPAGFVIIVDVFDKFLNESGLLKEIKTQLNKIDYDDVTLVNEISQIIRSLIYKTETSKDVEKEIVNAFKTMNCKYVAVRSSATAEDSLSASWAGELESYLNTQEKTLIKNIKNCWSSLFTPRAIIYRKEKDLLDIKVSVAVVVQEMIESEVSGVTFTVHPVSEDRNQMIIEAGLGLGEAIVSGAITPDSYIVDKTDWSIISINVDEQLQYLTRCEIKGLKWIDVEDNKKEKQKLDKKQIIELARICKNIEDHYGKPQDIEWAFKDGKFYIVQSRPITTL